VPSPAQAGSSPSELLPSIADVLAMPVVMAADPLVVAGAALLDRPVRWAHVTETESVAGLVSGGELLLSTGVGWREGEDFDDYVGELLGAGVAGLMLELGRRYREAPRPLVDACERLGVPLVVLRKETRFVAITEAVHVRIIAEQMNALRARDEIHALFTELNLRGSPADFIVAQLGRVLHSTVVLEDLGHRVVAAETLDDPGAVLADWEPRSRAAHRGETPDGSDGPWLIVPVEARGTRWGYLVALPGEPHPAGRQNVLEQGAVALALSRLADRDADEWVRQSQQELLTTLFGGRYRSEMALRARFEAAGLPVTGRRLIGVATASRSGARGPITESLRHAAAAAGGEAIAGVRDGSPVAVVVAALSLPSSRTLGEAAAHEIAGAVAAETGLADFVLAVGSEASDIPGLLASIDEACDLLRQNAGKRRGVGVLRAEDRPLLKLVTSLGGDPRLQAHSERMLRPLIEYDLVHDGDLLEVLAAYAAYPGNRTRAAATSHLSRSVFYQRIALIEDLLGADLDDGELVSALHAALLVRRRTAR
jgi:purine catabolism regulator